MFDVSTMWNGVSQSSDKSLVIARYKSPGVEYVDVDVEYFVFER